MLLQNDESLDDLTINSEDEISKKSPVIEGLELEKDNSTN